MRTQAAQLEPALFDLLKAGAFFYKHEGGRGKRMRKWAVLSHDGLSLRWRAVGANDSAPSSEGSGVSSSARGGISRSLSFSKWQSVSLAEASHIIYGPYTEAFDQKRARQDPSCACFSLVLRDSGKTVDLAAEDESKVIHWILGLQQLIAWFGTGRTDALERWTLPKLRLQKLRLKVSGESDRTGQAPFDVVLSAVLKVCRPRPHAMPARGPLPRPMRRLHRALTCDPPATRLGRPQIVEAREATNDQATKLQAAWRKRAVQSKFQLAVGEMVELNGLIDGLSERERELKAAADVTALKIETALRLASQEGAPPPMPSDADMRDPQKMQEYMLRMGEYSARQQIQLQGMEAEVRAAGHLPPRPLFRGHSSAGGARRPPTHRNHAHRTVSPAQVRENQLFAAEAQKASVERRQLQAMSARLQFSLSQVQLAELSEAERERVAEIQRELGVTPRGSIHGAGVREVRLFKEARTTRLGVIFHQNTPAELGDVSSDSTPRAAGTHAVVLPVIKIIDPSGVASLCADLFEGDEVLSVNGHAALSNVQAVTLLREAVGELRLAVRSTAISKGSPAPSPGAPLAAPSPPARKLTGLRPVGAKGNSYF